ncbi:hypothetical protein HDU98_009828, partial [Podochytrium sp. JEL0797]
MELGPGHQTLLSTTAAVLVASLFYFSLKPSRPKGSPPLAPHAVPILGHLLVLFKGPAKFMPLLFDGMQSDVVEANVFGDRIYLTRGMECARKILTNSKLNYKYANPEGLKQLGIHESGILLNANVEIWKQNRKFLVESIGRAQFLRSLPPKINSSMARVCALLNQIDASKTPVLANHLFGSLSLDVIVDILFSVHHGATESYLTEVLEHKKGRPDKVLTSVHAMMAATMFFLTTPPLFFKHLPGVTQLAAKHRSAVANFDSAILELIQQATTTAQNNPSEFKNLATILLQNEDVGSQVVLDVLKEAVGGGTDTSSNTMAFFTFELATHPEIAEQVYQEIVSVVGSNGQDGLLGDGYLESEDLSKLVLLEACIQETLRLHSVAQFTGRQLTQDVVVGEYLLKEGAEVWVAMQMNQTSPELWEDPLKFCPERFLEVKELGGPLGHGFAHLPFGAGIRKCPGEALALMEIKLVMANLIL